MEYDNLFDQIGKAFFEDDYESVISIWEVHQNKFVLDYTKEHDDKILEAIKVSYYETGSLNKSLDLISEQIRLLSNLEISLPKKKDKLKYYFNNKLSLLLEMNKLTSYYKTLVENLLLFNNDEDRQRTKDIEKVFYKKFNKFNNYLIYILILMVVFYFLADVLNVQLNGSVRIIYEIITWSGVVWVAFLKIFRKKIQDWYVKIFRWLFKPKNDASLLHFIQE